ncbi:MAG: exo-beta-N-acetylmuramidase NamZ domain-containing protein, partial [Vicinamibacteria bacterium]
KTRVPTAQMVAGLDALVFDLQDVGSRYYTFIYTMLYALTACAEHGLRFVVLDRPNPLGGTEVDGNVLRQEYRSFVGLHPLAARHGMTVGELALLFRDELGISADVTVVRMRGWRRSMAFEETRLPWIAPSPNMPTVDTAFVYPGGCLVEGTNLSEGRGTTRPFELIGAPWLDAWRLARDLEKERLPGVRFRPAFFTPTFQKHAGRLCAGVQVHVTERRRFRAFLTYLLVISHARRQDAARFAWRDPPYEYEYVKRPIDVLTGTDAVRLAIESGVSPRRLLPGWEVELRAFRRRRARHLLYAT